MTDHSTRPPPSPVVRAPVSAPPRRADAEGGEVTGAEGTGDGGAVGALEERIAELEADVARFEDHARRAVADLENVRKRTARDLQNARSVERENVARQFLPLVDHLELALQHASAAPETIVDGVETVLREAVETFQRLGFPRIDHVGESFDPSRHEAVSALESADDPPGTVLHVARAGYGEGSSQLRPASVVVSTRPQ